MEKTTDLVIGSSLGSELSNEEAGVLADLMSYRDVADGEFLIEEYVFGQLAADIADWVVGVALDKHLLVRFTIPCQFLGDPLNFRGSCLRRLNAAPMPP